MSFQNITINILQIPVIVYCLPDRLDSENQIFYLNSFRFYFFYDALQLSLLRLVIICVY
jgi:hypothetical protein